MVSTSEATTSFNEPGTPSIITSGSLLESVVTPRTRIVAELPGPPEERVTSTPEICPCIAVDSI